MQGRRVGLTNCCLLMACHYLPTEVASDPGNEELCLDCLVAPDVAWSEDWAETPAFHGAPMEEGWGWRSQREAAGGQIFSSGPHPLVSIGLSRETHSRTTAVFHPFIHSRPCMQPTVVRQSPGPATVGRSGEQIAPCSRG